MTDRRHPTLLKIPSWYSRDACDEIPLPMRPKEYKIIPAGSCVRVIERETGQLIYAGMGPVEVIESPAPF